MSVERPSPCSPSAIAVVEPPSQVGSVSTPRHTVRGPMARTRLILGVLVLAFVVASCEDPTSTPHFVPSGHDPALSLQSTGMVGSHGFHFLPPLVSNPDPAGIADMDRSPQVDICEVSGNACGHVESFSGAQILIEDEHYKVEWDAGASPVAIKADVPYRIQVSLGTAALGSLEVVFGATGNARRANTNQEVGVNRTVPIRFRIEEGTLSSVLEASECDVEGDDAIDDCDVVEGITTEEITTTVRDPDSDDNRVAGFVRIPQQTGALAGKQIVIVQKLLANPVAGAAIPTDDQVPYFLQVEVFDSDGERVTDGFMPEAYLALCQPPEVSAGLIPFLSIFRFSDGDTEIVNTNRNTPECFAVGASASRPLPLLKRMRKGVGQVAGLLRAQPLRALHGGLNTTTAVFSEFGAVIDLDEAPFDYGAEFRWSSSVGSGVGPAPFFAPDGFDGCNLDTSSGTGGSQVWPLGSNVTGQGSEITLTRHFLAPAGTPLRIWAAIDNDIKVTLNNVDITGTFVDVGVSGSIGSDGFLNTENCAFHDSVYFSGSAVQGVNTLQVQARNRGVLGYVNVRVELDDG